MTRNRVGAGHASDKLLVELQQRYSHGGVVSGTDNATCLESRKPHSFFLVLWHMSMTPGRARLSRAVFLPTF